MVTRSGSVMVNHAKYIVMDGLLGGQLSFLNVYAPNNTILIKHHIHYFGRFPISQFNDRSGPVKLICTTDWKSKIFKWP